MRAILLLLMALAASARAATVDIHYAPFENLEAVDVGLIENASATIDMAAYVLTDDAVIEALGDAADRGVAVRIYLDRGALAGRARDLAGLLARPGVTLRVKPSATLMHLKAYAVDRTRLRTGSGNFSRSGLSRQDNDLIVVEDAETVKRFENDFEAIFAQGSAPQNAEGF